MRKLIKETGKLVEMKEVLKYEVENLETQEKFLVNGAKRKEWKDKEGYKVTPKLVWVEI